MITLRNIPLCKNLYKIQHAAFTVIEHALNFMPGYLFDFNYPGDFYFVSHNLGFNCLKDDIKSILHEYEVVDVPVNKCQSLLYQLS